MISGIHLPMHRKIHCTMPQSSSTYLSRETQAAKEIGEIEYKEISSQAQRQILSGTPSNIEEQ